MSDDFRILIVCTGNICRSAQTEQFIRARIGESFPGLESVVVAESAGTGAMVGSGMPDKAAALSTQYGGSPINHSARQLTSEHVRTADLVLAMASEHRSGVVRLVPRASRNTFTLTEFASLLENAEQNQPAVPIGFATSTTGDRLRTAVKWASGRRGFLPPADSDPADVVDPYRQSDETYAESTRQILEALDRIERAAVSLSHRVGV